MAAWPRTCYDLRADLKVAFQKICRYPSVERSSKDSNTGTKVENVADTKKMGYERKKKGITALRRPAGERGGRKRRRKERRDGLSSLAA